MPLIKPRTNRVKSVRHICRLQEPNRDALVLYARFIGDAVDYVLNQLIETTLLKDREFLTWRQEHPDEAVQPSLRRRTQPAAARQPSGASEDRSDVARNRVPGGGQPHCERARRTLGLHTHPFPADQALVAIIRAVRPTLYAGFLYAYATAWFTSVFFLASMGLACLTIFVGRRSRMMAAAPLPPYLAPDRRERLFLVLGEQHRRTSPARAAQLSWLTIPERGLYTGILVVGASGSGKTSACMYPYVDQLLAYRERPSP